MEGFQTPGSSEVNAEAVATAPHATASAGASTTDGAHVTCAGGLDPGCQR